MGKRPPLRSSKSKEGGCAPAAGGHHGGHGCQPVGLHAVTLLEVLIATALFTVLAGVLSVSLMIGRRSYVSADAYVYVQQEARRAFDVMLKELRNAGQVSPAGAFVQRLDFQIGTGYTTAALCPSGVPPQNGICWGTDDLAFPAGWLHYALDTVTFPTNPRLMRCATSTQLDHLATPAAFAGCRVLSNRVNTDPARTQFLYTAGTIKTVTITLQVQIA